MNRTLLAALLVLAAFHPLAQCPLRPAALRPAFQPAVRPKPVQPLEVPGPAHRVPFATAFL